VARSFALGPVTVDIAALKIRRDGKEHPITRREADLIRFFAANPGRVISREELYKQVWHDSLDDIETRTVDMHIAKLRNKLETNPADPRIIKTIRGAGYLYEG
jgi:two-component system response regulator RegX3